ncbi:MAG: polymer-forming cytoskeletal protein, partial [Gemmobacter sp.]
MFSKSRINEPGPKTAAEPEKKANDAMTAATKPDYTPTAPKAKPAVSILSTDLTVVGNLKTTGDIQVEGVVEGDIRAHLLTVGEGATIRGEVVADDIVINGRVIGRVRGLKVRLTSTARVEGDIIHKTIAIESGAHFE